MFRSLLPKLSAEPLIPPNEFDLDFRIIGRVGGRVYKAIHDSGKFIAVKKIQIPEDGSKENQIKQLEDGVRNLQLLSHPNIVQYLGTRRARGTLFILMEFWGTSLYDKFALLNETRIRRYTIQLLHGLKYIHERKIVHGNIKGANIQVDASGDIKLADFGLSAHANLLGAQSSSGYRQAIEIFQPQQHLDPSADIWCVGCTMIELTSGKDPWTRESWSNYLLPKKFSFHAKSFLDDCLQWEQQQDSWLATSVLLQHSFLNATFAVRPTLLLPRENLVAEVLHSTARSPNYASAAAAKLYLDHHFGISRVEAAAEPSHTVEPTTMQTPNQAFALQHGAVAPVSSSLISSNAGSISSIMTEFVSSSFGSGVTFVSENNSPHLTVSSSPFPETKSNTSESESIPTVVPALDPNSTCIQEEAYVRKHRFVFLKFLCFSSP